MIQNLKQKRTWISYKKKRELEYIRSQKNKKKKEKEKEKSFTIAFYEVSYFEIIV